MDAVIVGAGVAGLNCAIELHRRGLDFTVLEASDRVGGRVRTAEVDGFLLDRGFQIFLTAYPEAKRVLNYGELDLRHFYPGALIRVDRGFKRVSDPWRKPFQASRDFLSGVIPASDKLRIGSLRRRVVSSNYEPPEVEMTTLQYLHQLGFSETSIERFFRPFLGGIFLDRDLSTSHAMFEFVFRMMSSGDTSLPAKGIGEIPGQMTQLLPSGSIRLNSRVVSVGKGFVELDSGEKLSARVIVLAVTWTSVAELLPEMPPPLWNSVNCFYFAAEEPPFSEPILVLGGEEDGPVSNLAVLSNVSKHYAPGKKALVCATALGEYFDFENLLNAVRSQLKTWYGNQVDDWRDLEHYRINQALPDQKRLPPARTPNLANGFVLCGDYLENGSLNGALLSGRKAAEVVFRSMV
jgi:phytoene dehydrogenase-like protein